MQKGETPLLIATVRGHKEVVRILLESGAQDLPDKVKTFSLHIWDVIKVCRLGIIKPCQCAKKTVWKAKYTHRCTLHEETLQKVSLVCPHFKSD